MNEQLNKAMESKWEELANGIFLGKTPPNPHAFNIGFKEGVKYIQSLQPKEQLSAEELEQKSIEIYDLMVDNMPLNEPRRQRPYILEAIKIGISKGHDFANNSELAVTKEQIIKTLYSCAKLNQEKQGVNVSRLFEDEADAILKLFSRTNNSEAIKEDFKYFFECGRNYQNNAEITFNVAYNEYLTNKEK